MRRRDPTSQSGNSGDSKGDAFDAMAFILTPSDEAQYWADVANSAKKREEREKASSFYNALDPISQEFNNLPSMQLQGINRSSSTVYFHNYCNFVVQAKAKILFIL